MAKAVSVYRGTHVESTHDIHVAVANVDGDLLYSFGDSNRFTFPRSSMKPFQAIALMETGAADEFQFEEADLAVICSSHSGEPFHLKRVESILHKIKLQEDCLQCGTHIPRDIKNYNELIRAGGELSPKFSNCSGKHAGMLAAVVYKGEDLKTYRELNHPHQQRILNAIEAVCDFKRDKLEISVDGCGVPVHGLPLDRVAIGFSRLANPFSCAGFKHQNNLERLRRAMVNYPELVAGTDRFDTDLMRVFKGRLVAKGGAEGVQCIGDTKTGVGIAIKVEDGNNRAATVAAMEVLLQLGICDEEQYSLLEHHISAPVLNARNEKIGVIKPQFQLLQHN